MKILMVNYEYPPIGGGGGQAHQNLLKEYARDEGLRVDVLTCGMGGGVVEEWMGERIRLIRVGANKRDLHYWRKSEALVWLWRAGRVYRRLIAEGGYDLVHVFFGFPSGYLPWRVRSGCPYVVSLRGSDVPGANPRLQLDYKLLGWLFRRIWRGAAARVACSAGLKARAERFMDRLDYEVIANGVDCERFRPSRRAERGQGVRLLTVGRLSASKRVEVLIDTVVQLREAGIEAELTVAGGGGLRDELEAYCRGVGGESWVAFRGRVAPEAMAELYREHDLLVSASLSEGMSNAWLEAMASGRVIVATRCEGVEELIGANGVVVEPGQEAGIAEAVMALINDRGRWDEMERAARERAELFSWRAAAERYRQLYDRLIGEAGKGGGVK